VTSLAIWLEGYSEPIGTLSDTQGGAIAFTYSRAWLRHASAHPISLSLPLQEGAHGDVHSRAFFGNLLQENDLLDTLLNREQLARDDIIGILTHLGADCSGAISCLPEGAPSVKRPGILSEDYLPLSTDEIIAVVKSLQKGLALPEALRDPSPVAGYRKKLSLALLPNGQFAVPKPALGVPTTHILKLPDPGHTYEAQHEARAAELARAIGLDAAYAEAFRIGEQDVILIQRFDRHVTSDGIVTRLHQEDFAQASGLPDQLKYERRGSPVAKFDTEAIGRVLAETEEPALARQRFLRMTLFNLIIGNTDNHAKNHALLYAPEGGLLIAPLYDMVPIPLGKGYTDEFAFNLGRAKKATELVRDDLIAFCVAIGFPPSAAPRVLIDEARRLAVAIEGASLDWSVPFRLFDMLIGRELNRLNHLLDLGLTLRARDYLPEAHECGGWAIS
jgi:serine/threonine-protein kinase HipA